MLTATRREWNELYVFFKLLGQGQIALGDEKGNASSRILPIASIERQEHDGKRVYSISKGAVRVSGGQMSETFPQEDFDTVSNMILEAMRQCHDEEMKAPDGVEGFLDALQIYDMEARTDDRTDFYLTFHDSSFPSMGFRIYSRLCAMPPLLDGGRTANLKYELSGIRLSQVEVGKINSTDNPDSPNEVARRMLHIEGIGGTLKFSDVADKVFRNNLCMIDLNFPRVLAEMARLAHLDNVSRIDELTALIEERNPLKIKEEMIRKHLYYRHKIKEFLLALALGMRPAKTYDGTESAVGGFVMTDAQGRMTAYRKTERQVFADFLFSHTRMEKGHPERDKYGSLERENRVYHMKLNVKIGFAK